MWKLRCVVVAKAVLTGREHIFGCQRSSFSSAEIIYADQRTHSSTGWLRLGCDRKPIVQGATFVGFKVAPANPTQMGWVQHLGNTLTNFGEHTPQAGMEKQRFVIISQEVIELQIDLRIQNADPVNIGRDFADVRHKSTPEVRGR